MILSKHSLLANAILVAASAGVALSQSVTEEEWGRTKTGDTVHRYTLTNANGLRAAVMTYGATLISVETPDRDGNLANITLHLPSFEEYEKGHPLFGSIVGRFANRIDTGGFTIDGKRFDLETVNKKTGVHIHGGKNGLQRLLWNALPLQDEDSASVSFVHTSPDGHEGFPGRVSLLVNYRLANDDSLTIQYTATTSAPTHLNLTNHMYWNLDGAGTGDVLDHSLVLKASEYLEFDDRKIPTGNFLPVENTPFDFREPQRIGSRITDIEGGGYDHCFVLNKQGSFEDLTLFARVESPASGRVMEVWTTEPGVQLYTPTHLPARLQTSDGQSYGPFHGFCLETQHFPDSPNKPQFPGTLLRPDELFESFTQFRFSVAK